MVNPGRRRIAGCHQRSRLHDSDGKDDDSSRHHYCRHADHRLDGSSDVGSAQCGGEAPGALEGETLTSKARQTYYRLLPLFSLGLVLGLWFAISAFKPDMVPSPLEVGQRFAELAVTPIGNISLAQHISISLQRVLIAFVLASVIGVSLGVMMGWSEDVQAVVEPIFELLRPIPPIAWIPLVILWLGIEESPKIFIVFIGAFIPVVLNTHTGVKLVDPLLIKAARVMKASDIRILREVIIPGATPAIFAGLKTALGAGWMCVLAAEMVGAKSGVGFLIIRGMESGDSALIICAMAIIGVVGACISVVLTRAERWLCPWRAT